MQSTSSVHRISEITAREAIITELYLKGVDGQINHLSTLKKYFDSFQEKIERLNTQSFRGDSVREKILINEGDSIHYFKPSYIQPLTTTSKVLITGDIIQEKLIGNNLEKLFTFTPTQINRNIIKKILKDYRDLLNKPIHSFAPNDRELAQRYIIENILQYVNNNITKRIAYRTLTNDLYIGEFRPIDVKNYAGTNLKVQIYIFNNDIRDPPTPISTPSSSGLYVSRQDSRYGSWHDSRQDGRQYSRQDSRYGSWHDGRQNGRSDGKWRGGSDNMLDFKADLYNVSYLIGFQPTTQILCQVENDFRKRIVWNNYHREEEEKKEEEGIVVSPPGGSVEFTDEINLDFLRSQVIGSPVQKNSMLQLIKTAAENELEEEADIFTTFEIIEDTAPYRPPGAPLDYNELNIGPNHENLVNVQIPKQFRGNVTFRTNTGNFTVPFRCTSIYINKKDYKHYTYCFFIPLSALQYNQIKTNVQQRYTVFNSRPFNLALDESEPKYEEKIQFYMEKYKKYKAKYLELKKKHNM